MKSRTLNNIKAVLFVGLLIGNGHSNGALLSNSYTPSADFSYQFLNGLACSGSEIQFTDNSGTLNGNLTFRIWDFGDGNSSSVVNPTHTYEQAGNFTVSLLIYNSDGDYDITSQQIMVNPLPMVNFQIDASTENQCLSTIQLFDNLSSLPSDDLVFSWDFNDGSFSQENEPGHLFSTHGQYEVTLFATSLSTGCWSENTQDLTILPEAVPGFEFENVCFGTSTEFINTTTVATGNVGYQWNFDDGTSSTHINPAKTFEASGAFDVTLQATTESGCVTELVQTVNVFDQPNVEFQVEDICLDEDAVFTNNSILSDNYQWYFGDENGSTEEEPLHTFLNAGNYQVSLVGTTIEGCSDSISTTLTVFPLPQPGFMLENVCEGTVSHFQNYSQISSGILSFTWDLGDDSLLTSTHADHVYGQEGIYQVELTATSDFGCAATLEQEVEIFDQPEAIFEAEDVCVGVPVAFQNRSLGEGLIYSWEFGDDDSEQTENPTHLYENIGTYRVRLTATNESNCAHSFENPVIINPVPVADFLTVDVCDTVMVRFKNTSRIATGDLNFLWNFDDGTQSFDKDPNHLYVGPGSYNVSLNVKSDFGCESEIEQLLTVNPRPVANFEVEPICDGEESVFTNTSQINGGKIESNTWDFGDGTNSIVENPVKLFLNPGDYEVGLTIVSDKGCESEITNEYTVYEFPVADFRVNNVCDNYEVKPVNLSSISGGDLNYTWDMGDGNEYSDVNPTHLYEAINIFPITLKASSSVGCTDSITKNVVVYRNPFVEAGPDASISKGFSVDLMADGASKYVWSPVDGLSNSNIGNPVASPLFTTTYTVLGIDDHGCRALDSITVYVNDDYRLIANNVFTPDGNGVNDNWVISNIETFGTTNVRVYDRYGKLVFQQEAYQNDWQGTYGNDILPDGTYYYFVTFSDSNQKYKGSVSIIRNR